MKKTDIYNFGQKLEISRNKIYMIILKVTDLSKSQLFLNEEIDDKYMGQIEGLFTRIVSGEPIEYILEKAEFYGLDFFVDSRCLVPRNDTEVMVSEVLNIMRDYTLIDVGTGSSCIPISILENNKNIQESFVVDISKKALEVSKINIKKYNLETKITQINGSLLDSFLVGDNKIKNKNLVITANLPYIKNEDFENMDEETIEFEPDLALYGGKETGFELYEELIKQCFELKEKSKIENLTLFIEIGFDQKEYSKNYLNNLGLKFESFKDNGLIDRCLKIEF